MTNITRIVINVDLRSRKMFDEVANCVRATGKIPEELNDLLTVSFIFGRHGTTAIVDWY